MDTITICTIIMTIIAILGVIGTLITGAVYVGRYAEKFIRIEEDCFDLKKTTDELMRRMIRVEDLLMSRSKTASSFFAAKHSPRKLNNIGQKVYDDMKGEEFLSNNKSTLYSKIDSKKPKTAYDVEMASYEAILSLLNDDMFNEIKVFIYNYPMLKTDDGAEVEVALGDAVFILSLPLRDMYLNDNPNILR